MEDKTSNSGQLVGIGLSQDRLISVSLRSGKASAPVIKEFDPRSDATEQIAGFIETLKKDLGGFERVGLALPGLINRNSGRVAFSASFPGLREVDLGSEIKERTGIDVILENDANAAALGEYRIGAGKGSRYLFYVTIGAGVGGSFIFDGRTLDGQSGYAGEFGYMAINSDGMRLEDAVSARNIVRRTLSRIHQDSTSALSRLDESTLTVSDIISAAKKDDDFAILMLERTGTYIGSALASVINLLNVDRIVIGGIVADAGDVLLAPIRERARDVSFGPAFRDVEIVAGELGETASAVGAAIVSE